MAYHASGYMKLQLINEAIVDCRLRGIYKMLKCNNHKKAIISVIDTITDLRKSFVEMDTHLYQHVLTEFMRIRVDIALKKYNAAHNKVRDLHFRLIYP